MCIPKIKLIATVKRLPKIKTNDKISQKYQNAYLSALQSKGEAGKHIPLTQFKGSRVFDIRGTSVLDKHKTLPEKVGSKSAGTQVQSTSLLTDLLAAATSHHNN